LALALAYTTALHAEEKKAEDLVKALNYPELEVTPKASERLKSEAEKERYNRWLLNWPVQLSALGTLSAGLMAQGNPIGDSESDKDANDWASKTAIGVGGGWLVVTIWAAAAYRPYLQGYREIAKLPKESTRDQLAVERISEEALARPAKFARPMRWLSVLTNLGASGYIIATSKLEARIVGWVSAVLALNPLFFEPHWQYVNDQHQIYKKKIYGPVSTLQLIPDHRGGLVPGVGLAYSF